MTSWLDDELGERRRRGLYRWRRGIESAPGGRLRWRGRDFLSFASNDYLNLAADPRLAAAAARAARRYGTGAAASPLVCGHLPPHRALERALARWEAMPSCLVFSSGFAANVGTITALVGRGDGVFSDAWNHASLVDGCRLSRADVHIYRHNDANHLQELLHAAGARYRRRLIVTDSVFSMDGDLAPLAELMDVAQRHDAWLLLDEAHATGVLGANGRGLTELVWPAGCPDAERLIKIGTLSKALGSQGGFAAGTRSLSRWLVNHARSYIFSTALAPPCAAAARRAVALVAEEPERGRHVLRLAELLRSRLHDIGYPATSSRCQIVPIIVGPAAAAMALSRQLEEQGLLVPAIRPPSVPEGTSRLRVSLSAGHGEEDVSRLVEALAVARDQVRV
ncbi:MAG: 8-amino-7-oxononanoate synthase [Gemmataceae bacterium]